MQFQNAFLLAMDSLRSHKLRSFLTLLGIIIGVASVIMVGAAIDGLGVYAEESTAKAFGSESFMVAQIVAAGNISRREYFDRMKRNKPIRTVDERYLESVNGDRVMYSPYLQSHLRCEAGQRDLRGHHHHRRLCRHGADSRYRCGGGPLLYPAGGSLPRILWR